jgi:hypothetical protein
MTFRTPSRDTVAALRKQYPEGTRVELVWMDDPYTSLPVGTQGTVEHVDDMGTIHITWDTGSRLGAAYPEDVVRKL